MRIVSCVVLLFAQHGLAVELKPETIEAFNKFIASVELRLEPCFAGRQFLWSDEFPGVRQQLLDGLVVAQPIHGNGTIALKGGLVQDWKGAVFIPRASLAEVLSVVQDYDHHRVIYKPDIADAKIESRHGDEFLVYMRIVKAKFMLSDVLSTEHAIRFTRLDDKRIYSRSYSKRINEVASPDRRANMNCRPVRTAAFSGASMATGFSKSVTTASTLRVNRSPSLAIFHSAWARSWVRSSTICPANRCGRAWSRREEP